MSGIYGSWFGNGGCHVYFAFWSSFEFNVFDLMCIVPLSIDSLSICFE